jgi:hypothetical protein
MATDCNRQRTSTTSDTVSSFATGPQSSMLAQTHQIMRDHSERFFI